MRNEFKQHLDPATCNMTLATLRERFPKVKKGTIEQKVFKLKDGGGLFLQVEPTGARGWRFYYQFNKKPKTISFGPFPEVSLTDARTKRDNARKLVAAGQDPSVNKQEVQRAAVVEAAGAVTFLGFTNFEIPNEKGEIINGPFWDFYINSKRKDGSPKCHGTVRCEQIRLRTLQAALGPRPIKELDTADVQAVLDAIVKKGNLNKAHRTQQLAVRIFDLAMTRRLSGEGKYNIAAPCGNALVPHFAEKMPALTDHILDIGLAETEQRVGELMRRIAAHDGRIGTRKALEMMALTFPRPGNIEEMEWNEIDGAMWTIPKHKMKMRRIHKVPLSRQAQEILDVMRPLTGGGKYVFPTSKQTMTSTLQKLGYNTETEQSTHGFRSIASTLLNESDEFSADAIELQMAHEIGSKRERSESKGAGTRAKYDRAARMESRTAMMQWYADYLDRLRDGNVVELKQAA